MGSPDNELGRSDDEWYHEVTLSRSFWMSPYEVTQAEYEEMMGNNPSRFADCPNCPVEMVSWHDAALFCNRLSARDELQLCYDCTEELCTWSELYRPDGMTVHDCNGYRLPTETEWERAARGTWKPRPCCSSLAWKCWDFSYKSSLAVSLPAAILKAWPITARAVVRF